MAEERPSHYLTELKRSGAPPCVVIVAISEGREDVKNGYRTTFQGAAARHQCRLDHFRKGRVCEDFATTDIDALWQWIDSRAAGQHRLVIVTVDLQQVLQTAGGYDHLPSRGWDARYLNLDAGGSGATWTDRGRRIVMCDLLTWIPKPIGGLRRLRDERRLRRLDVGRELSAPEADAAERCADIAAVWDDLAEWIDQCDIGQWRPTGAGTAFTNFRHRHMTHKMVFHDDAERRAVERYSAYSGRAEAYWIGKAPKGTWYEWDLHAAYARVCADTALPVRDGGTSLRPSLRSILSPAVGRCQLIEADVATDVPTLPWEDATGICWPVGTFRGVWWDRELRQAISDGATVKPLRSWHYRTAPALASWADWILDCLSGRSPEMTAVRLAVVKHWSRALIGRFGSRYRLYEYDGPSLKPGKWYVSTMKGERGQYHYLISTPTSLFMPNGWADGANTIPAILSYVMMETRMRLLQGMRTAGLDNVLHCDTDGFITNKTGNDAMERLASDGWRRKGVWRKLTVYGSRRLNGDLERRLPGVPKAAVETRGGGFVGEVRRSGTESLVSGQMSYILTTRREWNGRQQEKRRFIGNNGRTSPLAVVDNERVTFNK